MGKQWMISTLVYITCLFIFFQTYHAARTPSPGLFVGCGSSSLDKDEDGRNWEPDLKYIVSGDKTNAVKSEYQDPSLPSPVPYMNARIFTSETSYKFPIPENGNNRTLLRLHFYPSSYPNNFNVSNSYFSVIAGGITLLNNFSALITTEALSQSYIVKEYFLAPVGTPTLTVTIKPSEKNNSSFAFINGIEVITSPEVFDEPPKLAGSNVKSTDEEFGSSTVDVSTKSMQAMFRLNVGGSFIPPLNDSGSNLMRTWYDDSPYVVGFGITSEANTTIGYKGLSSYTAPIDVYKTSRSMGPDANVNKQYNLTWIFQVESNFSYIVRLHWCDYNVEKINQRVFDVYINNQTAEEGADVYAFTGAAGVPTKKDYMIYVAGEELRIQLHPSIENKPQWYDSILNGLEIFKISDSKANLAGPNPTISDMMRNYLKNQDEKPKTSFASKPSNMTAIIGGAAGGAAAFIGIAAVLMVAVNRKRKCPTDSSTSVSSWLPIYGNSRNGAFSSRKSTTSYGGKSCSTTTNISSDAACNCRYFSLAEIKHATKNFDESNVIGVGGFGKVYIGVIDENVKVAIKRSNPSSQQGVHEFQTEIEMLSKLRHRHLVSLIGFCEEGNEMVLVYDYMGHGTFREHLYKGNKTTLSWKQRLEICIGAARGLHYLHTGAKHTIIHRDVKTTNILLDNKWVAKVSDFGLSKTGSEMKQGHVSTVVKGSFGYLDPEYFRRQQLTEKSDVYSFGVVLFETLCGRPALNANLPKEQVSLADWALLCQRKGCLEDQIDPILKGKITPDSYKKFAETAAKCLAAYGSDRPSMGDVLWNLEFALQLQENPNYQKQNPTKEETNLSQENGDEEIDHKALLAMHRNTLDLDDDTDDSDNSNELFSQIVNPKGR
ncbi:hypothetical protein Leryth_000654 [Lithospermum erythrorhizon]|nr:hypothetical protein Leryth_000654 [Lithospermum erythrorhizon]